MKPSLLRSLSLSIAFALITAVGRAHPGHDDGHELTWDFGHLAAHPGATLLGFAFLGTTALCLWKLVRRSPARRS